jgi:hypothetical protein
LPKKHGFKQIETRDKWMIGLTGMIAIGGLISAVIFSFQLHEMKVATVLTRDTIEISRAAINAAQRPWVSVDVRIAGPLVFNSDGATLTLESRIKNFGRTPAINARVFAYMSLLNSDNLFSECDKQRNRGTKMFGELLFPNEASNNNNSVYVSEHDLDVAEQASKDKYLSITIFGCVDYVSTLDTLHHQSRFLYNLYRNKLDEKGVFAINKSLGKVEPSDMHIENIFGGWTAD